jgi:hypothetical protein
MLYLTRQEILDKVVEHFTEQGCPSVNEDNDDVSCLYRTENGHKCAVGIFIPDELYNPDMEGLNSGTLIGKFPGVLEAGGVDTEQDQDFMRVLQTAHDSAADDQRLLGTAPFVDNLLQRLRDVAETYNLVLRSN